MGIEVELAVLLAISVIGQSTFARFEIETPAIRKIVKWFIIIGLTLLLYRFVGHWALLLPVALGAAGTTVHFIWCRGTASIPSVPPPRASTMNSAAGRGRTGRRSPHFESGGACERVQSPAT